MLRLFIISFVLYLSYGWANSASSIRIGETLGLTGEYADIARVFKNGIDLWVQDINRQGGILGKKVELVLYDDRSDPQTAKELYQRLMDVEKVDFLFAPYSTKLTAAVLPLTEARHYPLVVAGAAGDSLWDKGYRYVVGLYSTSSRFTVGLFELLVTAGLDGIAIVNADDAFSCDLATSAAVWAERYGLKVVFSTSFAQNGVDELSTLAGRIRDSGAGVLLMSGHFDEAVNMRLALKRIGWYPKAYYASVGPAVPDFHTRLQKDANLVLSTSLWEQAANFPGAHRFFDEYVAQYQTLPGYHAALAYAGGEVLKTAIEAAGVIDPERVRSALFQLDTMTIIGRYGVDSTGKQVRQQNFIVQWQNGTMEIVWPTELRTADPVFSVGPDSH